MAHPAICHTMTAVGCERGYVGEKVLKLGQPFLHLFPVS